MDLDALRQAAVDAARAGGEVAYDGVGRTKQIQTKSSDIDLVTEFDRRSQEAVVDLLQKKYPDHGILAEEGLETATDAEFLWMIDPIDGTTNYAHNSPIWAVSVGLLHQGEPIVGVVYAPCMDECFVGIKGQGATLNGEPIAVSQTERLSQGVLGTGFSYDQNIMARNVVHFGHFVHLARGIRRLGSASLDLCWVAMGRFDGYWEINLNPWDVTAGRLIITEAGGRVTDFEGGAYALNTENLLSSNGRIHEEMLAVLVEAQTG